MTPTLIVEWAGAAIAVAGALFTCTIMVLLIVIGYHLARSWKNAP